MFRRDLAGALRDAGAVRVPGEGALGALVAALFGTLQPPYFAPREFEALHRALAELEAARGPGAADPDVRAPRAGIPSWRSWRSRPRRGSCPRRCRRRRPWAAFK